jgi:hypothetical protein
MAIPKGLTIGGSEEKPFFAIDYTMISNGLGLVRTKKL